MEPQSISARIALKDFAMELKFFYISELVCKPPKAQKTILCFPESYGMLETEPRL